MKRVEISDDFFSGLEKADGDVSASSRSDREAEAVKVILGTKNSPPPAESANRKSASRTTGVSGLLTLPFELTRGMLTVFAVMFRAVFSLPKRR